MADDLVLACADIDAPPLFRASRGAQWREGYEPDVGRAVAAAMSRRLEWLFLPWAEMLPAVAAGDADGVLCGQGISPERLAVVDFSRPYAVFDESVLVRADSGIASADDLHGRAVAAIAGSVNMALAETFAGAHPVAFAGDSVDVFAEMVAALRAGRVDAVVDDDVALIPLAGEPDLDVAFTVATRNPWGIAVSKARPQVRAQLDRALDGLLADGTLSTLWRRWMPQLAFPL
jgi:polar amino acid transport system substrate-binding protein